MYPSADVSIYGELTFMRGIGRCLVVDELVDDVLRELVMGNKMGDVYRDWSGGMNLHVENCQM